MRNESFNKLWGGAEVGFRQTRQPSERQEYSTLSVSISRTSPYSPTPYVVLFSSREKSGEGGGGKRNGCVHRPPVSWWVRVRSLGGEGSMGVDPGLHVLSLQIPATPSPVGLGSGLHIVWEARHQLHFLRNAVGLRHLSLANCFHYSKLSLREHALMDELSRLWEVCVCVCVCVYCQPLLITATVRTFHMLPPPLSKEGASTDSLDWSGNGCLWLMRDCPSPNSQWVAELGQKSAVTTPKPSGTAALSASSAVVPNSFPHLSVWDTTPSLQIPMLCGFQAISLLRGILGFQGSKSCGLGGHHTGVQQCKGKGKGSDQEVVMARVHLPPPGQQIHRDAAAAQPSWPLAGDLLLVTQCPEGQGSVHRPPVCSLAGGHVYWACTVG